MTAIDNWAVREDDNYISALKFVNDLGKIPESLIPLKVTIDYVFNHVPLDNIDLYIRENLKYSLAPKTGLLDYETAADVLQGIHNSLDNEQIGIVFSREENKGFSEFYFKKSDFENVKELIKSQLIEPAPVDSNNNDIPINDAKSISNDTWGLDEHQKALAHYEWLTPHEISCFMVNLDPINEHDGTQYKTGLNIVERALKSGKLKYIADDYVLLEDVKRYFASKDWIFKGFNDALSWRDQEKLPTALSQSADDNELKQELLAVTTELAEAKQDNTNKQARIEELERLLEQKIPSQTSNDLKDNWKGLTEYTYPPELHLSLMIWQRIYQDNVIENQHVDSHTGKFKVIAKQLGLNPESALGKRISMICNTYKSKKSQSILIEQLQAIESIQNFE